MPVVVAADERRLVGGPDHAIGGRLISLREDRFAAGDVPHRHAAAVSGDGDAFAVFRQSQSIWIVRKRTGLRLLGALRVPESQHLVESRGEGAVGRIDDDADRSVVALECLVFLLAGYIP